MKGSIGDVSLLECVYLWTGNDSREENAEHLRCIKIDIREIEKYHEILIIGDMNAH